MINKDELPRVKEQKPFIVLPDRVINPNLKTPEAVKDPCVEQQLTAQICAHYEHLLRDKPAGGFPAKPDWRSEYNSWAALPWWRRIFTAPPRMP